MTSPVPPPTRRWLAALGLLTALVVLAVTGRHIYVEARLRGDIGGPAPREMVVHGPGWPVSDDRWELDLRPTDRLDQRPFTITLSRAQVAGLHDGAPLRVRCDGTDCYLPASGRLSDDHLTLDTGVFALVLVAAGLCAYVLVGRQRAWRRWIRGAHLPAARAKRPS